MWWGGGKKDEAKHKQDRPFEDAAKSVEHTVSSTTHAVKDAAGSATDAAGRMAKAVTAVGAEQREAVRLENREIWGRVKEGDTLWSLSEKYLGDGTKWPCLQSACKKELGSDPLRLLPGSYITEACLARAQELSRKGRS